MSNRSSKDELDQKFEAYVAHLVGVAQSWGFKRGPSTPELAKALKELREYYYSRVTVDATPNPLAARCYTISEPHLSGYRLVIGFETRDAVDAAQEYVSRLPRGTADETTPPQSYYCVPCMRDVPIEHKESCPAEKASEECQHYPSWCEGPHGEDPAYICWQCSERKESEEPR